MQDASNSRNNSIDILKGVGITLMIMGHIGFGGKFDRYIHSFHMPLFFIVSGYLYSEKREVPIKVLLLNKVKRFLVPYIFFAIVNYVCWLFVNIKKSNIFAPLGHLIWHNTEKLPICGAIWFLTAIFWTEVIYIVIQRTVKNRVAKEIIIWGLSVGISIVQSYISFTLPLSIDIGIVCMGFYHVGHILRRIETTLLLNYMVTFKFNKGKIIPLMIVVMLSNFVLTFVTPYINVKMRWYGIVPAFWGNAILGTIGFYLLALIIDHEEQFPFVIKIGSLLATMGKNSIVFLGFNQLLILFWNRMLKQIDATEYVHHLFLALLNLCFSISSLLLFSKVINYKKLNFLIGKK